jgi:hypothetical protein
VARRQSTPPPVAPAARLANIISVFFAISRIARATTVGSIGRTLAAGNELVYADTYQQALAQLRRHAVGCDSRSVLASRQQFECEPPLAIGFVLVTNSGCIVNEDDRGSRDAAAGRIKNTAAQGSAGTILRRTTQPATQGYRQK